METKHTKVFSSSSIIVNGLKALLEENNIGVLVKNPHESGISAGFGTFDKAVEIHIHESDVDKATPIIENFKKEIE